MEFKQAHLSNGLTLIAEVTPASASMAVGFFVRAGSRDETPEISGVSHFLEHMMFKGTARRSAFDVNREFDDMGASYNAFTSEENTVYYAHVLPEFQVRAVDLLGDMMRPALRNDDFDTEKNVICEEIALYEDRPEFKLYEQLMVEYFAGHPLGNLVLGTRESIRALRREQMKAYFDRAYSPSNIILVATGHLDWDALVEQAQQLCGDWETVDTTRELRGHEGRRAQKALVDANLTRQHVGMMSPAPEARSKDRFAAQLLSTILGDDSGSRLYYALVEPAIADDASCGYHPADGTGMLMTYISADPDKAAQAVEIARAEYATFLKEGPTDAEMNAAKNKIASASVLRGELPMGRLTAVGSEWVYRHVYESLSEQIKQLMAVPAKQVLQVAQQFDLTNTTTLTLGPRESV